MSRLDTLEMVSPPKVPTPKKLSMTPEAVAPVDKVDTPSSDSQSKQPSPSERTRQFLQQKKEARASSAAKKAVAKPKASSKKTTPKKTNRKGTSAKKAKSTRMKLKKEVLAILDGGQQPTAATTEDSTKPSPKAKAKATPKASPKPSPKAQSRRARSQEATDVAQSAATEDQASDEEDTTEIDKLAHKLYMRYWRSMNKSRTTPAEIKALHKRFRYCKDQQSALYEDFLKCGGRWTESSIYKEITNTHIGKKRGVRRWLTKSQMRQHFDADIVEAIAHRKKSDPELAINEVRSHPEHEQLEQFLVLIEDEEEQVEENRVSDMFQLKQTKKSSSCNVTSEDDGDEEEEEESSGDEDSPKKPKKTKKGGKSKKGKVRNSKKQKKPKSKKKKSKKSKNKNKAKTVEDEQKEARKELVRKAKKVIQDLNKKIHDANSKKLSTTSWSETVRKAMLAEVDSQTGVLGKMRTNLQKALDMAAEDAVLEKYIKSATDAIDVFDSKMEPITGKKRRQGDRKSVV